MRVLDRHIDDIDEEWKRLLCESKMTNSYLVKEMPKNIRKRLRAHKRAQLDEELVAGKSIWAKIKDYAHTKGQEKHERNKAKTPGSPVLPLTSLSNPEGLAAGTSNLKSLREQQQERALEAIHSESAPTAHPQQGTVGGAAATMSGTATAGTATAGGAIIQPIKTLEDFANAVGEAVHDLVDLFDEEECEGFVMEQKKAHCLDDKVLSSLNIKRIVKDFKTRKAAS
eukprot:COSAG01_NODE_2655_length_7305_cov_11.523175_2_plen_226_part_00